MAYCFSTRQRFGPKEENTLHRDKCQPTESLKLCLSDYEKLCTSRLGWGKFLFYTDRTARAKVKFFSRSHNGHSKGLVNTGTAARDGNGSIEKLCSLLSYDGRNEDKLAQQLVEVARNGADTQVAREYAGCNDGVENIDEKGLIRIVPPIHGFEEKLTRSP
eukprot:scaffold1828_cov169-Amphora_coffeaeformis.AAC.14